MPRLAPCALLLLIATVLPCAGQDAPPSAERREADAAAAAGDLERAAELYRRAAAQGNSPEATGNVLLEGARALCRNPARVRRDGWELAIPLLEQAAAHYRAAKDAAGESSALLWLSASWQPGRHREGSWARAEELARRALACSASAKDAASEARALHQVAFCMGPDHAASGTWLETAAVYERAAEVAAAEVPLARGKALHQVAVCLVNALSEGTAAPTERDRARRLFLAAASLRESNGDRAGAAESYYNLGRLHQKDHDPSITTGATAEGYFRRAAEEYALAGDRASEAESLMGQGRSRWADVYTDGDWAIAAATLSRAVVAAERGGDAELLARALYEQAWSESHGGSRWTPKTRQLLDRSREVALREGSQKIVERIDAWLAKSAQDAR